MISVNTDISKMFIFDKVYFYVIWSSHKIFAGVFCGLVCIFPLMKNSSQTIGFFHSMKPIFKVFEKTDWKAAKMGF